MLKQNKQYKALLEAQSMLTIVDSTFVCSLSEKTNLITIDAQAEDHNENGQSFFTELGDDHKDGFQVRFTLLINSHILLQTKIFFETEEGSDLVYYNVSFNASLDEYAVLSQNTQLSNLTNIGEKKHIAFRRALRQAGLKLTGENVTQVVFLDWILAIATFTRKNLP